MATILQVLQSSQVQSSPETTLSVYGHQIPVNQGPCYLNIYWGFKIVEVIFQNGALYTAKPTSLTFYTDKIDNFALELAEKMSHLSSDPFWKLKDLKNFILKTKEAIAPVICIPLEPPKFNSAAQYLFSGNGVFKQVEFSFGEIAPLAFSKSDENALYERARKVDQLRRAVLSQSFPSLDPKVKENFNTFLAPVTSFLSFMNNADPDHVPILRAEAIRNYLDIYCKDITKERFDQFKNQQEAEAGLIQIMGQLERQMASLNIQGDEKEPLKKE